MNPAPRNDAVALAPQDDSEPNLTPVRHSPDRTYGRVSEQQLRALADALGRQRELAEYVDLQRFLFDPWSSHHIPPTPLYPSAIGDDHSPYEYSLAFSRRDIELRILFEAQAETPSAKANQLAAEAVNERLRARFGVDFSRFDRVRDLFLPEEPQPHFSLWHAVCLNPGRAPDFKIYLNPAAQGRENARGLVREAMRRLGFGQGVERLLEDIGSRGATADEVRYFSLDLSADRQARVKVYFAHQGVTARELESAFSYAPTHRKGDVIAFCDAMIGRRGPFNRKPLTSCFSFVTGYDKPSSATLHVPVTHYLQNDEAIARRVRSFLDAHKLCGNAFSRALHALADRPLDGEAGLQSYASYRREKHGLRVTLYLSPALFTAHEERSSTRLKLPEL
jgi:DMATS type aromatic prenyltransferase